MVSELFVVILSSMTELRCYISLDS